MLVVDTNCIVYLYLNDDFRLTYEQLLIRDQEWIVPSLWRSEFLHVLHKYMRAGFLAFEEAARYFEAADHLIGENEFRVNAMSVLELANYSGCSTYDCEFVVLAKESNCSFITADKKLLKSFPDVAVTVEDYLAA